MASPAAYPYTGDAAQFAPWKPIVLAAEALAHLIETNPLGHERDVVFVRRSLGDIASSRLFFVRALGRAQPVQHWAILVAATPDRTGYVWELLQEKNQIYLSVGRWEEKRGEMIGGKRADVVDERVIGKTRMTDWAIKTEAENLLQSLRSGNHLSPFDRLLKLYNTLSEILTAIICCPVNVFFSCMPCLRNSGSRELLFPKHKGNYNVYINNCQDFAKKLAPGISTDPRAVKKFFKYSTVSSRKMYYAMLAVNVVRP